MLNKARIAVLVSGGGTNLEALLNAQEAGALPHGEIVLVLSSNPEAYAWSGPTTRRACHSPVPEAAGARSRLRRLMEADAVPGGSGRPGRVPVHPVRGLRPSLAGPDRQRPSPLIPAFCGKGYYGLKVHEAALDRGVKVTGATVHLVNEIPGRRPHPAAERRWTFCPATRRRSLQRRVMEQAEWVLLPQAAEQLAAHIATEKEDHL